MKTTKEDRDEAASATNKNLPLQQVRISKMIAN
jgi:hypothetical protein